MDLTVLLIFLFILGAAFGSFFGVLIDRLPNDRTILGRSKCDFCKKTLHGQDLIPIVSFLLTGGRSRCCGKKLSYFYPFIEILTGLIFVGTWLFLGNAAIEKVFYLGIMSTLVVIFFADVKYQIIPDSMQVSLLIFSLALKLIPSTNLLKTTEEVVLAGLIVMAPILLLYIGTRGRGMGFGDVKLAFVMGVLLGWAGGLIALYFGFVSGAIVGIVLYVTKKKKLKSKIAFGPFLIIGIVTLLLFQDAILAYIKRLYG